MKPENPEAFPRPFSSTIRGITFRPQDGMTLRDYFAAVAMQGLIAADPGWAADGKGAALAYKIADDMLKERQKPKQEEKT